MHREVLEFVEQSLRALPVSPKSVFELGSRDVNGSPRHLFPGVAYIGVDLAPGPGVDIVADAADWRPDGSSDLVLCLETLEHTDRAKDILLNAMSMVAPGGALIVTAATDPRAPHSAVDGAGLKPGEYYGNISVPEFASWCQGARRFHLEVDRFAGDLRALVIP